jgi:hypothetical protein
MEIIALYLVIMENMNIQYLQKLSEMCVPVVQSYFFDLRNESIVQPGCELIKYMYRRGVGLSSCTEMVMGRQLA